MKKEKQDHILKVYAEKKEQLAKLQEELDDHEAMVMQVLDERGIQTLQETYGTFSVVNRKKWTYTKELVQKELEYNVVIKERKSEEQKSGEAKVEEIKGLSYRKYEPKEN